MSTMPSLCASLTIGAVLLSLTASPARAELAAPNAAGVAMGHLHYFVDDVLAHREF